MSEYHTEHREGLKEELGWLKVLIVLAGTLEFSLVGWVATAHDAPILRSLAGLLSVIVGLMSAWVFWRASAILATLKGSDL